jgi:hypothetical protein
VSRPGAFRHAMNQALARRGDDQSVECCRRALLGASHKSAEVVTLAARGLGDAIALVLADGVPRTSTEIAKDPRVCRQRQVVDTELPSNPRFVRVPPPPTKSRRARTWTLSSGRLTDDGTGRDKLH